MQALSTIVCHDAQALPPNSDAGEHKHMDSEHCAAHSQIAKRVSDSVGRVVIDIEGGLMCPAERTLQACSNSKQESSLITECCATKKEEGGARMTVDHAVCWWPAGSHLTTVTPGVGTLQVEPP